MRQGERARDNRVRVFCGNADEIPNGTATGARNVIKNTVAASIEDGDRRARVSASPRLH